MRVKIFSIFLTILTGCTTGSVITELDTGELKGEIESIIEETFIGENEIADRIVYSYFNEKGFIDSIIYNYKNGLIVFREIHIHTSEGKLIETDYINDRSSSKAVYVKISDSLDSLTIFDENNIADATGLIYFNKLGKEKKVISFSSERDTLYIENMIYDKSGKLIEREYISKSSPLESETHIYSYNKQSQVERYTVLDSSGSIETLENYQYSYDDQENWITKKILDQNNECKGIRKRKIEYR